MVSLPAAAVLGIVEGVTEFVPVSSTGHLIVASTLLGLGGEAVAAFEIVIQAGALAAVVGMSRARMASMWRGLRGHEPGGGRVLRNLCVSFLPTGVAGALWHRQITERLFGPWPVAAALAAGGVLMVGVAAWQRRRASSVAVRGLESMTAREALLIGIGQCASLWPGTSRAMATIVAGLWLGWPIATAAEYSFLLAVPTLGAATAFAALRHRAALLQQIGVGSLLVGFLCAAVVAALAIRGFLRSVTRWGLAPFGWYRLGFAAIVCGLIRA